MTKAASATRSRNWRNVESEVLDRIHSRQWKPGELIPTEADLAAEFGCSRTTVNRALRSIADTGLLDRKRKAGTRIATHPVRKATLDIPVIRREIEARGQVYSHHLIDRESRVPPASIRARMKLDASSEQLHLRALHLADNRPYAYEDRWLNFAAVPEAAEVNFDEQNANEWLVVNAPYTKGDIAFLAIEAPADIADILGARTGDALFAIDRTTWNGPAAITSVRIVFARGYVMQTTI